MTKPGGGPIFAGERLDVGTANVGALSVSGLLGAGTGFTVNSDLVLSPAISQIVPGVTSLSFRNNANNADNLIITDAGLVSIRAGASVTGGVTAASGNIRATSGNLTFGAASAKVIPGATSFLFRNNADNATNLTISDAGVITTRGALVIGNLPAFAASDKYLVVDASGNVHVSGLGPAS